MKLTSRKKITIALLFVLVPTLMFIVNPYGTSSYDVRARLFGVIPYRIPSRSMTPTLQVGDFIVTNSTAYAKNKPEINDVIVFKHPQEKGVEYVKRVIALEGDELVIEKGEVWVNGSKVEQFYIDSNALLRTMQLRQNWSIPEGHLFVLGDNRDQSKDSRFWGFLPLENIVGKVTWIWMSNDLSRIGTKIK